jgi:hypothetical protein
MVDNKISIVYEGAISQQLVRSFLGIAEEKMERTELEKGVKKRVFRVLLECLQNVSLVSEHESSEAAERNAIFIVGNTERSYVINTGIEVNDQERQDLEELVKDINAQDKAGLKNMYLDNVKQKKLDFRNNLALSLIDIAKKTDDKLNYDFKALNTGFTFFTLQATVSAAAVDKD